MFSLSALKIVNGCLPNVRLSVIKQSLSSDYFGCMNGLNGCRRGKKGAISFRKRTLFAKAVITVMGCTLCWSSSQHN